MRRCALKAAGLAMKCTAPPIPACSRASRSNPSVSNATPICPINAKTTNYAGVVPPAFHNLNSPTYQNCTVCHQKVHGSYVDRNLLK